MAVVVEIIDEEAFHDYCAATQGSPQHERRRGQHSRDSIEHDSATRGEDPGCADVARLRRREETARSGQTRIQDLQRTDAARRAGSSSTMQMRHEFDDQHARRL